MEGFEYELQSFRKINSQINIFFRNISTLNHPDFKLLPNDEFTFLGGKFKFVRSLSLAKKIGMVDVFYWVEEKGGYEIIKKFNLYFYDDGLSKITGYLNNKEQSGEKGALESINISLNPKEYLYHFYQMLIDQELILNLIDERQ